MTTPKKTIPLKKLAYYLALSLLTTGASLILGFLSFSGMYALLPLLPLAYMTFFLSVAYEGEIYLQNLKGALAKLFKPNYLEHSLAKDYLLEHAPDEPEVEDCPQFFKDYKAQVLLLAQFEHKELNAASKKKKKELAKTLNDMERWFAKQLFIDSTDQKDKTAYALELQQWLALHQQTEWQEQLKKRRTQFNLVKGFSLFSAAFMGLGSTYLMVEAFSAIPFIAALSFTVWPVIILPLALIAGTAYGLLTYNAITDLINNNTIINWYNKLRENLNKGLTPRTLFMTAAAIFLVTIAVALTICTAGTWWTIATKGRPLFNWMYKMPRFIMGIINPIVTGGSAIFFNIQNSAESLEMLDKAMQKEKGIAQRIREALINGWNTLRANENLLQIINPFRIFLKLTVTPLRILFFLGHLASMALTSDRVPGIPKIIAIIIAIISEGFEDAHYFVSGESEEEEHSSCEHQKDFKTALKEHLESHEGHEHGMDIPTWLIRTVTAPIYALAALWDYSASQLNKSGEKRVLSFGEAWNKQRGIKPEEEVLVSEQAKRPGKNWQIEHSLALIDEQSAQLKQASINPELAQKKVSHLQTLKTKIIENPQDLEKTLKQEKNTGVYNQHRLFALEKQTSTQKFVEELPERIGMALGA